MNFDKTIPSNCGFEYLWAAPALNILDSGFFLGALVLGAAFGEWVESCHATFFVDEMAGQLHEEGT